MAAPLILGNLAHGGTIILEGSDAIAFHCEGGGTAGACTYEAQVWRALDGSSGLPIAVIENSANGEIAAHSQGSGVTIDNFSSVAAAGTLSNYAALYFEAFGTCCSEDDSLITASGASSSAVAAYLAGGGAVMIEDYTGGSAWDFAVHSGGAANAHVAGVSGGLGGSTCNDDETVTATGTANGFTQPPAIGCWEHQAYQESFFGPLGFTLSFYDARSADYPAASGPLSGLLSSGTTLSATPEPGSIVMMGLGLIGVSALLRKRKAATKS